jgi:hypothetical protein
MPSTSGKHPVVKLKEYSVSVSSVTFDVQQGLLVATYLRLYLFLIGNYRNVLLT